MAPNHFGSYYRVYISFPVHVVLSTVFRLADDLVASRTFRFFAFVEGLLPQHVCREPPRKQATFGT